MAIKIYEFLAVNLVSAGVIVLARPFVPYAVPLDHVGAVEIVTKLMTAAAALIRKVEVVHKPLVGARHRLPSEELESLALSVVACRVMLFVAPKARRACVSCLTRNRVAGGTPIPIIALIRAPPQLALNICSERNIFAATI
jgi:hypothetical protein